MLRVLVVYETDALGRPPAIAQDIARGAEESGAEVRTEALDEADLNDIRWADAVALGIEGRDSRPPHAVKHWLDAFGFSGWRAFRNKSGFVFATRPRDHASAQTTCRMLARLLNERGMEASTPSDLGMHGRMARGRAIGRELGAGLPMLDEFGKTELRRSETS